MEHKKIQTYWANIYIAGPKDIIKQVCREYCMQVGLCVTVKDVDYIYTGGEEQGVEIGLINYPRFPSKEPEIFSQAIELGHKLMEKACQKSFSITTPTETHFYSRKHNFD